MKEFWIKINLFLVGKIFILFLCFLTSATTIANNNAENYKELGYSLFKEKKYDEAIELYKKAIQLEPFNYSYHTLLAYVYLEKKMYDEAIQKFNEAFQINPDYPLSFADHASLAKAYIAKKEYNKAIEEFKKAEKSFNDPIPPPRSAQITIYKEWLDVSKQIGDLARVEEITQKIEKLKGEIESPPKEKIIKERRVIAKEIFPSILVKDILQIFIPIIIILILVFLVYLMQRKRRKSNRVS